MDEILFTIFKTDNSLKNPTSHNPLNTRDVVLFEDYIKNNLFCRQGMMQWEISGIYGNIWYEK